VTHRSGVPCPSSAQAGRHVVIVGAGGAGQAAAAQLTAAAITDILILDDAAELISSVFDEGTEAWTLRTATGEILRGRIVVAAHSPPTVPWIPELAGRDDFRGASFPAAHRDPGFDPTGKRIAVIGADTVAGHYIGRLPRSAAVTVFAHAPRRIVPELPLPSTRAKRWLRRHLRPGATHGQSGPALVASPISAITASGIRTCDGVDHPADAIVYGTGFAIADRISDETLVGAGGMTIRQAWNDGMEPCFGVAVHGFPNYFFLDGPEVAARAHYVAECVRSAADSGATRIEVRRSSQRVFNERVYVRPARPHRVSRAFELSSRARRDREGYDGAATLTIAGTPHPVRARLAGHLDPIDGHYHWQGTIFESLSQPLPDEALRQARTATLTVGERSASARIIEQTPWGTHSVAGVGVPPYPLGGA
jgi:cation diffusion facilitator CzcD-associated flavoprotein CzcO